ncbi:MAG: ATP-binding cassette domain-containing protein [Peptococcaceae bacterium]|nr:ATP-binding cassette domain-containing protein [Peptococcaceae bacterium]
MINCEGISKQYSEQQIFNNFTYAFPEKGFVLLFGESGCGKTTLLNIIAGLIPFDEGAVSVFNDRYEKKIDSSHISPRIAYITQDTHFIDYLTVFDNMKLCSTDDKRIDDSLKEIGLKHRSDSFPKTLSGGEKQRLAILQALLLDKDILILDEPTSSLDKHNKIMVFETLAKIKQDKLIICSSHDAEAQKYSDEAILFHRLDLYRKPLWELSERAKPQFNEDVPIKTEKRKLYPFLKQWNTYTGREKKSMYQFVVVITLCILALCLGDTPQNKLDSNIQYTYKLNQLRITMPKEEEKDFLNKLTTDKNLTEITLQYNMSIPLLVDETTLFQEYEFDVMADTLPYSREAFAFSDRIRYGSYFTNENQVVLSYEKAFALGNPEELLGEELRLELYDDVYLLEIVGIFDKFSEIETQYLKSTGITNNADSGGNYFLNGKFTSRYISDEDFYMFGNRTYVAYFQSFQNMKAAYKGVDKENSRIQLYYADVESELIDLFRNLFLVLLPLIALVVPLTMLFYYQTQKIEMTYNKHIYSVFQYLGYPMKTIKRCLIRANLAQMLKMTLLAAGISVPLMIMTNIVNGVCGFVPFIIFTANVILIISFFLVIVLLSVLLTTILIRRIKRIGWYDVLLGQRDLL